MSDLCFLDLAFALKELGQDSTAFILIDSGNHVATMIESWFVQDLEDRTRSACFGVHGADDDRGYPRVDDCPGAHRTGLERDVESAIF